MGIGAAAKLVALVPGMPRDSWPMGMGGVSGCGVRVPLGLWFVVGWIVKTCCVKVV